ncbi:hypothetical protein MGWOODY_Tha2574 [hydrothermal vent metagenome]|uniref:Uncharacterized protein n=1 Tax=hydrothermal vent metagenome TaxID=652676 RepID=A0A160TBS1_9ZZZZ
MAALKCLCDNTVIARLACYHPAKFCDFGYRLVPTEQGV